MLNLDIITKSTLIDDTTRDLDNRGSIISIVDSHVKNVSLISCNQNTIRSNHYHYSDWHIMHVLEGCIHYFYKGLKEEEVHYIFVDSGKNIFTPPNEIHATYFPVNTKLIVSSKNPRDQETYEKDTVRVNLINNENLNYYLSLFKINE